MREGGSPAPERHGLILDERPRGVSPLAVAASLGAVWGVLGYAVLWEGRPFAVERAFVESVLGTIVLLPVRVVLRGIHLAEDVAGRTFELSSNHGWIGVAATIVGALVGVGLAMGGRALVRRLRGARRGGSIAA